MITDNWAEMEKNINIELPCLLHIDMDYFNNRYNASTSWKENQDRHDPAFSQQKFAMDNMIASIENLCKNVEIRYVLIGISPSFYPSEFWEDGLNYSINELYRIGIGVGNKIFKYKGKDMYV